MKKLIAIALIAGLFVTTGIGCNSDKKTTESKTNATPDKTDVKGSTSK